MDPVRASLMANKFLGEALSLNDHDALVVEVVAET